MKKALKAKLLKWGAKQAFAWFRKKGAVHWIWQGTRIWLNLPEKATIERMLKSSAQEIKAETAKTAAALFKIELAKVAVQLPLFADPPIRPIRLAGLALSALVTLVAFNMLSVTLIGLSHFDFATAIRPWAVGMCVILLAIDTILFFLAAVLLFIGSRILGSRRFWDDRITQIVRWANRG